MSPLPQTRIPPELLGVPLVVLHQDEHLLVFDKPSGLPSVPGRGENLQDCLAARAQALWPDARIVHRLDMATSGVIVMARGLGALRALSAAFEHRRVEKRYVAVVAGRPDAEAGSIDLPLRCDWPNRPRQMVDPLEGRHALTHWRRVGAVSLSEWHGLSETDPADRPPVDAWRVELTPVTGRSHQLRVHLAAIGHPIVGDTLYASTAVQRAAPRLLLHACRLMLPHPFDGHPCVFECAAPF
jgi:tRNA pseudouridine32 synthase/23S rRNA pseudouridine746 synthase